MHDDTRDEILIKIDVQFLYKDFTSHEGIEVVKETLQFFS